MGFERSPTGDTLARGPLLIDPKAREARLWDKLLDLTRREFDLLACLAAHPGWVLSAEELYEQVWGYDWGADRRLVSVHMGNLRRKLGESGADPGLIQTVRGAGYKLTVPDGSITHGPPGPLRLKSGFAGGSTSGRIRLVGREAEKTTLLEALARAAAGEGSMALLWGEAGIGKTRLVEELAHEAQGAGIRVLFGRCLDGDGLPAYWPWLQILRQLRDEIGPSKLVACAGVEREALLQLLPELRPAPCPEREEADSIGDQYHLYQSVCRLLVRLSTDRACLIALDDLPWADQSSLFLLQVLAPELTNSRILLVATVRSSEVPRGHRLAGILPSFMRAGAARLDLCGLAQQDVGELMRATAGADADPELVEAVTTETLGNPLHICELVRLIQSAQPDATRLSFRGELPLPPTVSEIVARRAARLSTDCQELLDLCALAGRSMSYWVLHRASGLELDRLLKLLDEAIEAQLLEQEAVPGHYRFSHPLVQETLTSRLGHLRRLKLHARMAESFLELSEQDLEPHLSELAHHLYQASPLGYADQAVEYNLRAGRQDLGQLAFEQAAAKFTRGLEALGFADNPTPRLRAELLVELGEARAAALDPAAREIYREAAEIARAVDAPDLLARAALGFEGRMMGPHSVDTDRAALLEEALALLPPCDSALRVRIMSLLSKGLAELANVAAPANDPLSRRRRQSLCDQAVPMARRLGDRALIAHALNARWYALYGPDNLDKRHADAWEALALGRAGSDPILRWNCAMYSLFQMLETEQMEESYKYMDICESIADRFRVPFFVSVSASFRALQELWQGRLKDGLSLNEESSDPWSDDRDWLIIAMQLMFRHLYALLTGDPHETARLEAPLRALIPPDPLGWAWKVRLTLVLARLKREQEAQELFDALGARDFADLPREQGFVLFAAHLAETAALLGDEARAGSLYRLLKPYEGRAATAFQFFDGPVAYFLGLLSTTVRSWEQAEGHLKDSITRSRRMGAPPYVVRSQVALAEVLLQRGRPDDRGEALRLLADALPRADTMGMVGYAAKARELTVVAGAGRS